MTQEEKAKRYDEAISIAKEYDFSLTGVCAGDVIQDIFPELAESEDERIRKELIVFLEYYRLNNVLDSKTISLLTDSVAWLEEQGEQNLANSAKTCKVEPKFKVKYAGGEYNVLEVKDIAGVIYYGIKDEPNHIDYVLPNNCEIVSEKNPAWSEEDENKLSDAIFFVREYQIPTRDKRLLNAAKETEDWLKSLRPQSTWKPSDEQMKALKEAVDEHFDIDGGALWHLYQELKNLKDEK